VARIERAYEFGARAHAGQVRLTGEPYIGHPVAVAHVLAEMHMDAPTLIAALLHDVLEDTPVQGAEIAAEFGEDVAGLVEAVSKLTQIRFDTREEAQAAYIRKMLLAVSKDLRVILIKLADRLHNMRTLQYVARAKRRRTAYETLEIYAPIANRLGMHAVHQELEDLAFAALHPLRHRVILESIRRARGKHSDVIGKAEAAIRSRLAEEGVPARLSGRVKQPYSIYLKMRTERRTLEEILDIYALRVTVGSVDACYRALGVVHNVFKPTPGRFRDYIAIPKANGYQSLHTTLVTPYGVPLEVQIRTEEMDRVADDGVAAHWRYKTGDAGDGRAHQRAREWLQGLAELSGAGTDPHEFMESVKGDLFPDEVYVFTPKGRIMALPAGATALDFAYAVHSDIGDHAVAARINGALSALSTMLETGATVEVLTAKTGAPHPSWLSFVVTGKARSAIRRFLKDINREKAIELGRRLLERELAAAGVPLETLPADRVAHFLAQARRATLEDVLEEIGLGRRMALLAAQHLTQDAPVRRPWAFRRAFERVAPAWMVGAARTRQPLAIRGTEGVVVSYAKCCRPIPGDRIRGFVSGGRGVVVHVENCRNTLEFRRQPDKWLDVQWDSTVDGRFPVDLRADVRNRQGQLAVLASAIAEEDANIQAVHIEDRDGYHAQISFTVEVRDRMHLARILRRLRTIREVRRILRKRG
jgi:GTP diphosphokinase / guanosine-3',5'-bis(diphosphate) 3'-diphosphatase